MQQTPSIRPAITLLDAADMRRRQEGQSKQTRFAFVQRVRSGIHQKWHLWMQKIDAETSLDSSQQKADGNETHVDLRKCAAAIPILPRDRPRVATPGVHRPRQKHRTWGRAIPTCLGREPMLRRD